MSDKILNSLNGQIKINVELILYIQAFCEDVFLNPVSSNT
jgi:hypothetical protein